jgi:outer membrane protein assembly factor BamA
MTPSLMYDSRDNIFTPTRGTYFEGTAGLYDEVFGGDSTFQRVGLLYIGYLPVHDRVTLGIRGGATFAFGDTPFYMLPFITLRGAAWNDFEHVDNEVDVVTGGTGFRYELARKYGLHAGLDAAFGPDGTVFYIQFGSAWARP